jgi:hypothetical protein
MAMTHEFDADAYKRLEAYMDAVEGNGPQTTLLALLEEEGMHLPAPENLTDTELTDLLWRTIHALADLGVYLDSTNHLSDRELYTVLWDDQLRREHPINPYPDEFPMVTCMDLLGGWSNEDLRTHLKYYADEEERTRLGPVGDDDSIPEHVDPPFDRDHLLPRGI